MRISALKLGIGLIIPISIIFLALLDYKYMEKSLPYLLLLSWINLMYLLSIILVYADLKIDGAIKVKSVSWLYVVSIASSFILLLNDNIAFFTTAIAVAVLSTAAIINTQYMRKKLNLN